MAVNAAASGSMYRIELFGRPRVLSGNDELALSPLETALVCLVYGSRDRRVRRAEAGRLLWGKDGREARHRLSQLIYSVNRKGGGRLLVGGGEHVRGCREDLTSDIVEFEEECERGALLGAHEMLSKGFLSGIERVRSRDFESWMDEVTEELRQRLVGRAAQRWAEVEKLGDWAGGVAAAQVLYEVEPWNEKALRRLMTCQALMGNVGLALETYNNHLRQIGDEEDDLSPEAETLELAERLGDLGRSVPRKAADAGMQETSLHGRATQLSRLRDVVFSKEGSALRFVAVRGEGGIGKTRLVDECLGEARLRGYVVLSSRAAELERQIPLNALLETLSSREVSDVLRTLADPWRAVLWELMPELREGGGDASQVPLVQPGALQRRLFEAIRQLLVLLSSNDDVVLFLDDFHWADDTSIAALEYVRRRWDEGFLTVVFALRPEEIRPESEVSRFLSGLEGWAGYSTVDLDDLAPRAAEQLVTQIGGRALRPGQVSRICALAGGNPLFLIELTADRVAERGIVAAGSSEQVWMPLSVAQVIGRRLSGLSRKANQALGALAVWARPASLREVGWASRLGRDDVVEALDELQATRLVRWEDKRVTPRHELIRQAAYRRLSEAKRGWLHGRVARYLTRYRAPVPVDEVALHFDRAGDRGSAFRYAREAARRAEEAGALPEAMQFLAIAHRNAGAAPEAMEILGSLAKLKYLQMHLAAAAPLLTRASEHYRSHKRLHEALLMEVWGVDALSRSQEMPVEEVVEQLAEIKREAREAGQWEAVAEALDVEWHLLDRVGETAQLQRVLREGEECVSCGNARAAAICHRALALLHQFYGDPQKALRHAVAGVRTCEQEKFHQELLRNLNVQIAIFIHHGLLGTTEGQWAIDLGETLGAQSGDLFCKYNVRANVGVWFLDIGELERATALFSEAERLIGDVEAVNIRALSCWNRGELCYETGQIEEAVSYFARLLEIAAQHHWYAVGLAHAGLGLCAMHVGDLQEARRQEELVRSSWEKRPRWINDPSMIVRFQSQMLHRRGDTQRALELLEETARLIRHRQVPNWIKIKLETARLLSKVKSPEAAAVAREAYQVAAKLGLERRCQQLQAFL